MNAKRSQGKPLEVVRKPETIKKIVIDVTTNRPISQGEIAIAVDLFRLSYVDRPEILAMHHSAYRDIAQQLDAKYLNFESIMGLKIFLDPELSENEWRVRKVDEKTYNLETTS
jgi:hypothetical protein